MKISLCDVSEIATKAPCEAALTVARHVRIEIADFVMRTFVLRLRKNGIDFLFYSITIPLMTQAMRM